MHNAEKYKRVCRSCLHKGPGNPFFGKKHTKETRKIIGKSTIDRNQSAENNPFFGKQHSDETRQVMSKKRSEGIASGRIKNNFVHSRKSTYKSTKMNEVFYADSALELFRMHQLDHDNDVISWTKRHGISIAYEFEGSTKHYVPDFLIVRLSKKQKIIEEVKGYDVKAGVKKSALQTFCIQNNYELNWLTQDELTTQGYREFLHELNHKDARI